MSGESLIESEMAAQFERNEKLIEVIRSHDGDLEEIRSIDFFFNAGSATDAAALAEELRGRGFEAAHSDEEVDGKWPVQAVLESSVASITAPAFVESLVRLTAKYLAELDGWGTAV